MILDEETKVHIWQIEVSYKTEEDRYRRNRIFYVITDTIQDAINLIPELPDMRFIKANILLSGYSWNHPQRDLIVDPKALEKLGQA